MFRKIIMIGFALLGIDLPANCMAKKEQEQKSIETITKNINNINEKLKSVGLIPDLCKIIGEYDGYRPYHQIGKTNGGHTKSVIAFAYCKNLKCLASGSWDNSIKLLGLSTLFIVNLL